MSIIQTLKEKVLQGEKIDKAEAMQLVDADFGELCKAADEIRQKFCGNGFDMCTITSGKNGKCSENCKYCAQAGCYHTGADVYPLLSTEEILKEARRDAEAGVPRYSIVTSGKRLSKKEVDQVCESIHAIKEELDIDVCASFGLLEEEDFKKLKAVGVTRVHNNLETSRTYFPKVCSTHTYDDKIQAIKAAQKVGMSVCCGGLMGIGETMEDRIDMALTIRELGVDSVPVNVLNPIPGTPLENQKVLSNDEVTRIVAIFRFILPDASIRMAGGRSLLGDMGRQCFQSGANATISGSMLTTAGITIEKDMALLEELGYKLELV